MPQKLLLFICSLLFIILNHNLVLSDEKNLIPLKKPKLTDQELKEKVLINILKPLQKPKLVKEILQRNHLNVNDIDVYIFHQASKLVLDTLTKNLKIPNEKIFNNYDKIGNTVSASIPIAMKDALDSKYIKKGHKIMLIGFGVGLSWGACVIDW